MSEAEDIKHEHPEITDADLGIEQPDYKYHLPDEQTVAEVRGETAAEGQDLPVGNVEPVPPGTPDRIAKCFRAIPGAKIAAYRAIYDGFEKKDMPFPEFCVEMACMASPIMAQQELEGIMEQRMMGYSRKTRIDTAMKAQRN